MTHNSKSASKNKTNNHQQKMKQPTTNQQKMCSTSFEREKKVIIDYKIKSYNFLKEVICRCCRSLTFNEPKTCSHFSCFLEVQTK